MTKKNRFPSAPSKKHSTYIQFLLHYPTKGRFVLWAQLQLLPQPVRTLLAALRSQRNTHTEQNKKKSN